MIKNIILVSVAVFAAAYSQTSLSAAPYPGWTQAGLNSTGQMTWFGPGRQTLSTAAAGNAIWSTAMSGGGAIVNSSANLAMGSSKVLVAVKGTASAAAVFGTVKAIMGGPVGIAITALTVAPAVIDWLKVKDIRFAPVVPATGEQFERRVAGCTDNCQQTAYAPEGPWYGSDAAACTAFAATFPLERGTYPAIVNPNIPRCTPTYFIDGIYYDQSFRGFYRRIAPPTADSWTPASIEQIRADMEANPLKPQVVESVIAAGGQVPIAYAPDSVSGPASVSAPAVVSRTTSGDVTTTSTSQTKTDITYGVAPSPVDGKPVPTVTGSTNTTIVTTTVNNVTGATTTTNSTVNNPIAPEPEVETASDSALPEQPKLYKKRYPDGIIGVYRDQRDVMAASPLFTLAAKLMPTVGSSGACPRMPINLTFSSWANFGVKDVAPPCEVWDWGKAICIVSACLLARRLIFGG